jgi:SagB-type dehydrogenase family enzyme
VIELATVRCGRAVYPEGIDHDDPAELYHEASKLSPLSARLASAGAARLLASPELRASAARAIRRNRQRPLVELPPPTAATASLESALQQRRSVRAFGHTAVSAAELSTLLTSAYGVTGALATTDGAQPLRSVPSGGALFPLELYACVCSVAEIEPGIYHYDPLGSVLETVSTGAPDLCGASPYRELVETAAVVIVLAAVFWRSRFKYGLRGYRYVLLEAGHVAQNVVLAASALELASVPLGGFYERPLDALLELDGVDESSLYVICVGTRAAA